MMRPCVTCGELSEQTYCPGCKPADTRNHRRDLVTGAWIKLSRRARTLQPFCTLCGSTRQLEADHHPRAWARAAAKKTIRLCDVTVLCQRCNSRAGSSKPDSDRYRRWEQTDGNLSSHEPDAGLTTQGRYPLEGDRQARRQSKFGSHTPGGIS